MPPPCSPRHRARRRRAWGVPPFGLRRRIFWALVWSMLTAGLFAWVLSLLRAHTGFPMALVAVCFVASLWAASGRLAYRLALPLDRLVGVVQRFGEGDLSARARFPQSRRDEVARVAAAIDAMADRIEQQVKEERRLLAAVSHELRTPMARIRVLTDLARSGQTSSMDEIDREVAEMDYLVSNLLARSRLEFGNLARKPVSLPEAAGEALDRAGQPQGLLHVSGDRVHEPVEADPTLLHRAIANLVDNAQRHGHGVTSVQVRSNGDGVSVEVLDSGPGFEAGNGEDRFKAFARQDSGATRGSGLGLGLNLVQRIIVAHGGRVWAENRAEGGASAGFELPFRDSP